VQEIRHLPGESSPIRALAGMGERSRGPNDLAC
jgi:hypothetical protein